MMNFLLRAAGGGADLRAARAAPSSQDQREEAVHRPPGVSRGVRPLQQREAALLT